MNVLRSVSAIVFASGVWCTDCNSQAVNNHLYVYNECNVAIVVNGTKFKFGQDTIENVTVTVAPGHQEMLAVSDRPAFSTAAQSVDNLYVWQKLDMVTADPEYTHVYSCSCSGQSCPDLFKGERSRQYAK